MSTEESLPRAEELLARLEAARGELDRLAETEGGSPDRALEILGELSELAKSVEEELERAKRSAEASLRRFAYEWARYMRGDLPVKNDKEVTEADLHTKNLILFGDPGSNRWIEKALPRLPLRWTRDEFQLGSARYAAADHVPVLIQPNPLAEGRYLVLNSGHTFHEKELASLNYLLFPRMGDWAVLKVGGKVPANPSDPPDEAVVKAANLKFEE